VVHNWKDVKDQKEAETVWGKQVKQSYVNGVDHTEHVVLPEKPIVKVETLGTRTSRHVYLMSDNSEVGRSHNECVFELLRKWIVNDSPDEREPFKPVKFIQERAQAVLRNYVTNVRLEFNEQTSYFNGKPVVPNEHSFIRNLNIDLATGLLTSAVESNYHPKYDMFEIASKEQKVKNLKTLEIYVDIPGISLQELKITKSRARKELIIEGGRKESSPPDNVISSKILDRSSRAHGEFKLLIQIPSDYDLGTLESVCSRPGELKCTLNQYDDEE